MAQGLSSQSIDHRAIAKPATRFRQSEECPLSGSSGRPAKGLGWVGCGPRRSLADRPTSSLDVLDEIEPVFHIDARAAKCAFNPGLAQRGNFYLSLRRILLDHAAPMLHIVRTTDDVAELRCKHHWY